MSASDQTPNEEEIFQVAVALPIAKRAAYLRSACAGTHGLQAAVELLLAAVDDNAFMHRVVDRTTTPELEAKVARLKPEAAGDIIGNCKLLQQIGEGGFGTVWMAEQEKPVRRRVALKIIKLGMDTKQVIARFEQERQALAIMDHPNIARVFDAGATPFGRPYFVMELVRGVKITEYCDQTNLTTADRLRLFVAVCNAIQHAHQKGVIHRDLKPSNILVTLHDGVPVPKVIDFGVAKATQRQRLTDLTLFTHFEQMIGTPLYMSPEQAELSGLDIDTRSDIYSLGVLLYELLTGRTPFDPEALMRAGLDEIRRVIREEEPQKPSTFVSTMAVDLRANVAQHRQSDGARLIGLIRGDLDWIVMKALEKDRTRRYDTASGLGRDIERHMNSEPVLARPASAGYRFRRFVRRNKVVFAAGASVAAALIIGITVSVWQALRARHEADRANNEAARASAALADLQSSAPAFADQARGLVANERFEESIEKLEYAIKLRPDVAAYVLTKADLLQSQLRFAEAAPLYRKAMRLNPAEKRAGSNAVLCDKLAKEIAGQRTLSRESLAQLFAAMSQERRSAAELMLVGKLLGEETSLLLTYWLERLKDLPIPPERPLGKRLKMCGDGLLALDLSGTKIVDLTPLEGMPLGELDCTGAENVSDLSPLRAMPLKRLRLENTATYEIAPLSKIRSLEELNLSGTKLINLDALAQIPLKTLRLSRLEIRDLSPLRGMPLEELDIRNTRVTDLSPLSRLPLKRLSADSIPAIHFAPLADLPLEFFSLRRTRCYDLAFLRKMPLRELFLTGCFAANSMVLSEIQTLEVLGLPEPFRTNAELGIPALRNHPRLREIGFESAEGPPLNTLPTTTEFWKTWDREGAVVEKFRAAGVKVAIKVLPDHTWEVSLDDQPVKDLSPLRGSPIVRLFLRNTQIGDLNAVAGMSLKSLSIQGTKVSDLSPLTGMPLEELELIRTAVTDLRPLQGMPLRRLGIEETAISDLSPLQGMALQDFWMGTTQVSDLSPLKGMPLRLLHIDDCPRLTDVSPLLDVPALEQLFLPKTALNVELLRPLPNLKFISFEFDRKVDRPLHSSEEFWSMTKPIKEDALAREQRFAELERLIRSRLQNHRSSEVGKDYLKLGAIALATGDHARYRELCAEMQRRPPGVDSEMIIKVGCSFSEPGISEEEMRKCLNDLKSAYGNAPGGSLLLTYALCEYRLGLWDQASKRLRRTFPNAVEEAIAHTLLALTNYRQGNFQATQDELAPARVNAEEVWPTTKPPSQAAPHVGSWQDCLLAHLLLQEVEKLIAIPASSPAAN